ncbi:hypothetical protein [Bacillus thuringiensis]|uniref:hypothetical protein n=1 Tax=Bacillus thuringiensis TaxID=1428 RepID=UPI0035DFA53F
MEKCIYLKDSKQQLSFDSEEHIFPAGLGGIRKLPKGYVSDECNNFFSGMETEFMRRSPLAIPRQFVGPGKRGKLNEKYATKSDISLMSDENSPIGIEFGYISLGKPYSIPQFKIRLEGKMQFISDQSFGDATAQYNNLMDKLEKFNNRYTIYEDERIDENSFLIGYESKENKWHIAFHKKDHGINVNEWIERVIKSKKNINNDDIEYGKMQPKVIQSMKIDLIDFHRVYAKIAFNFLAELTNQEFVLDAQFDPIRNWILHGGENEFVTLTGNGENFKSISNLIPVPKSSHLVMIIQNRNHLFATISFYGGQFEVSVLLSDRFDGVFEQDGFICDWENRQEFRIFEYMLKEQEKKLKKIKELQDVED